MTTSTQPVGVKCRELHKLLQSTNNRDDRTGADNETLDRIRWFTENCRMLSVYTVKIAAMTNHSGFCIEPALRSIPREEAERWSAAVGGSRDPLDTQRDYVNFGAEGMYRLPKWDLSCARYKYLDVLSLAEIAELERGHTRAVAGWYFWLTNCCHHNTERELLRLGFDVQGARTVSWFDEQRVHAADMPKSLVAVCKLQVVR